MPPFSSFRDAAWVPSAEVRQASHLSRIIRALGVTDIESLHHFAVHEADRYYQCLVEYFGISFRQRPHGLVDESAGREFPRWFPEGRINLIDTCLRRSGDEVAVVVAHEQQRTSVTTRLRLREDVQKLANYLSSVGIGPGDCVGLFMPLTVEATVAFFACAWVGAVVVPAFSGYGPDPLAVRLKDSRAKVLIGSTGFHRRGAWVDMHSVARRAVVDAPALERVILVGDDLDSQKYSDRWEAWTECLIKGADLPDTPAASLDPNHPLLLIYTSGTTGRPKGIVHSHAGFLVKTVSDFALILDLREGERLCWVTDLGWLVGPQMMVANAALGSIAVYYVGALDTPDWGQIWRVCAEEKVHVLGLSPTAVRGMAADEPEGPSSSLDLSHLRAFTSTGEPWDQASWRWLFGKAGKSKRPIVNYAGGTEVAGGILCSYAALPLTDCAFTGPIIGMDADIIFEQGAGGPGQVGELVVRNTWPGMTHSFWGGDDDLYLETYWSTYLGTWRHGDLAERDEEGWWYLRGRSDDTLKIAGRRVGPAEIESVLLESTAVVEAAVIGAPDALKGQSIIAFIVAAPGVQISVAELQSYVSAKGGPSLVPSAIHVVKALPKTRNGKIVRRAIAARYLNRPTGDLSGLESVEALLAIPQAGGPL